MRACIQLIIITVCIKRKIMSIDFSKRAQYTHKHPNIEYSDFTKLDTRLKRQTVHQAWYGKRGRSVVLSRGLIPRSPERVSDGEEGEGHSM